MDEKDRALVEQVVKAAGKAGEQGFQYMVDFTFATGITDLFGYSAWIALAYFLGYKMYDWKIERSHDSDVANVARGAGMLVCALVVMGSIGGVASSITKIIQPAGAAIHSVVSKS